ncbi:MAG: HPr family phosphocarrier protein [Oscillospiraceae bacterium]|nr:HPr family phosphocarrier protein [Oscillospiraceae bacterium]
MISKDFIIKNKTGIHARPASDLCVLSKGFESSIRILCGSKVVNPRSVVSVLTGDMSRGKTITVEIDGADEEKALAALTAFFNELDE